MPRASYEEMIGQHLPYEIDMLVNTYNRAKELEPVHLAGDAMDRVVLFAVTESCCVHARTLIEFFFVTEEASKRNRFDDAKPQDFAPTYKPDPANGVSKQVIDKLHRQFAHLSWERTDDNSERMLSPQREKLLESLIPEIDRFTRSLADKWKPLWPYETSPNSIRPKENFSGDNDIARALII